MIDYTKALLYQGGFTCVLTDGQLVFTSTQRGIRPLLEWVESETDFHGFYAADKVVGKAAGLLYCLLGIRQLYAAVISESALAVLQTHGISVIYDRLVPGIRNRSNTGPCPMEQAPRDTNDPQEAVILMKDTLKKLSGTP